MNVASYSNGPDTAAVTVDIPWQDLRNTQVLGLTQVRCQGNIGEKSSKFCFKKLALFASYVGSCSFWLLCL